MIEHVIRNRIPHPRQGRIDARQAAGHPAYDLHGALDDPLVEALAGTARGERETFAALYRAAAPVLMGVALKVLRRRDAAEDVLQEAFVAIWDKASQYKPERGAPMT